MKSFSTIIRLLSILWSMISLFMILPIVAALYYREPIFPFLIPMISILSISGILALFYHGQVRLTTRDVFILVPLGWIGAALVSTVPFVISGAIPSFTNAFFESMSGLTTTGASILSDIESLPKSILLWRSGTHWLGGMGIVVLTVALLPFLGIGGLQLLKAEAPGPNVDKVASGIASSAKILWAIYFIFTIAEIVLLMFGRMSLFDALTHTFGTLATGGFSPKNNSVGYYNSSYIHIVITVFMVLAGANFGIYYRIIKGKLLAVKQDSELKAYCGILFFSILIITIDLIYNAKQSVGVSIRDAAFQATSMMTTTGFATVNYINWPELSKGVLFLLMWIGGCSGSTGGGVKVIRYVVLAKQAWHEIHTLFYPQAVLRAKSGNTYLSVPLLRSIGGFIFIYLITILLSTIIVATAGYGLNTSLSVSLATLGNIGPGFGKVGPALNYAAFPGWMKLYFSFIMLLGRLELYTVIVFLLSPFKKRF